MSIDHCTASVGARLSRGMLRTHAVGAIGAGVSLDTFVKYITMQRLTEEGIRNIGPTVEAMAAVEGLDAHKRAVTTRLTELADSAAM